MAFFNVALGAGLLSSPASLPVSAGEHSLTMSEEPGLTCSMAIPPRFDAVFHFEEGVSLVKSGELWGYVDHNGKYVVYPKYKNAGIFRNGMAPVQDVFGKWGYIDKQGRYVIQSKFSYANSYSDGLAFVRSSDGKGSFINSAGDVVILEQPSAPWIEVRAFSYGFAPVKMTQREGYVQKNMWLFIDKTGKPMNSSLYFDAREFSGGLAAVKVTPYRWGFIDQTGRLVIQASFSAVEGAFTDGFALVKDANSPNPLWSVIDHAGQHVIRDIPLRILDDFISMGEKGIVSMSIDTSDPRQPIKQALLDVKTHSVFTVSNCAAAVGTVSEGLALCLGNGSVLEAGVQAPRPAKFGFISVRRRDQGNTGNDTGDICIKLPSKPAAEGKLSQGGTDSGRGQIEISPEMAARMLYFRLDVIYPPIAKAKGVSGTVVLRITISKQGTVTELSVVSGPPELQQAALDGVKKAHYRPYLLNNEPVEVETTVNVTFTLGH